LVAFNKLCRLYNDKERALEAKRLAYEERNYVLEACLTASAHLLCLERVYKKVCLKEYCLVK